MMTLFFASRSTASESAMVMDAGSPSGKTATMMLMARMIDWWSGNSRRNARPRTMAAETTASATRNLISRSSFCWSGVRSSAPPWMVPAIFPISVAFPVRMTAAFPMPLSMRLPLKRMFFIS